MVAAGASLTFNVDGQVTLGLTDWRLSPEDLRSGVINALRPYVGVNVVNVNPLSSGLLDWTYRAVVQVTTLTAHADADDVGSIVEHAFYEVGHQLPTATLTSDAPAPVPGGVGDYKTWIGEINERVDATLKGIGAAAQKTADALPMTVIAVAIGAIVIGVLLLKAEKP